MRNTSLYTSSRGAGDEGSPKIGIISFLHCLIVLVALWFGITDSYAYSVEFTSIHPNITDKTQLQRGAKVFMNYCSGCHSLKYMRYNNMAQNLGLLTFDGAVDTNLLKNNLIFTTATIYDPIQVSMPEVLAREWFGRMPPDLSLTARERGPSWIYTFLKSFYYDPKRPFHSNNLLVQDTSMPDILEPLSGLTLLRGNELILFKDGDVSEQAFDAMIEDVVTFLTYVAEPHKLERVSLGYKVILFLLIWLVIVWRLYKVYWKRLP